MDPQADKLKELSEQLRKKEEELQALSKEVQKLDFDYRSDKKMVNSGVAIFVTLLVTFFGITLTQIPAQVVSVRIALLLSLCHLISRYTLFIICTCFYRKGV